MPETGNEKPRPAAAGGPAATGAAKEPLPLDRYATIQAEIDAGEELEKILERENLTRELWLGTQAHWLKRMADEAQRKRFETTKRYQAIFTAKRKIFEARFEREKRKRERAPIEPPPVGVLAAAESELAAPIKANVPSLSFPEPPPVPQYRPAVAVPSPAMVQPPPPMPAAVVPPPAMAPAYSMGAGPSVGAGRDFDKSTTFDSAPPPPSASSFAAMPFQPAPSSVRSIKISPMSEDPPTLDDSPSSKRSRGALPFRAATENDSPPAPVMHPPEMRSMRGATAPITPPTRPTPAPPSSLETRPLDVPPEIRDAFRAQKRAIAEREAALPFSQTQPGDTPNVTPPAPGGLPFGNAPSGGSPTRQGTAALPFDKVQASAGIAGSAGMGGLPFGKSSSPPLEPPRALPPPSPVGNDDDDDDEPRTKMVDSSAFLASMAGPSFLKGKTIAATGPLDTASMGPAFLKPLPLNPPPAPPPPAPPPLAPPPAAPPPAAPPPAAPPPPAPPPPAPPPPAPPPAAPPAAGAPPPPPAAPMPAANPASASPGMRFNLNQFASLTAEVAENPQDVDAIRRRYGVTETEHREESGRWTAAFQQNDELRQQYLATVQRYRGFIQARKR